MTLNLQQLTELDALLSDLADDRLDAQGRDTLETLLQSEPEARDSVGSFQRLKYPHPTAHEAPRKQTMSSPFPHNHKHQFKTYEETITDTRRMTSRITTTRSHPRGPMPLNTVIVYVAMLIGAFMSSTSRGFAMEAGESMEKEGAIQAPIDQYIVRGVIHLKTDDLPEQIVHDTEIGIVYHKDLIKCMAIGPRRTFFSTPAGAVKCANGDYIAISCADVYYCRRGKENRKVNDALLYRSHDKG